MKLNDSSGERQKLSSCGICMIHSESHDRLISQSRFIDKYLNIDGSVFSSIKGYFGFDSYHCIVKED